jgi:nitroreductase
VLYEWRMQVAEAVARRRSIRAFTSEPVELSLLREVVEQAARAPSGGNLQPWRIHVLTGEALARFRREMAERLRQGGPDDPEYEVYPPKLHEPYRTQRFVVGEGLYALLGIARDDKAGRLRQFDRNYDFFGAPVALFCFIDRRMGPGQWSDLGMYLQTLMLLLQERGLESCAQEAWSAYHKTVSAFVQAPPEQMLFCGMAIGHADPSAPENGLQTARASLETFATFHER